MKILYRPFLMLLLALPFAGLAQVPLYNSYPSASATVFIDFDGQYVQGTSWNWSGPLSLNPSNLSTAQMTEIFNRVSEDYRPFNVNITTDSTKYWAAPATKRVRVILTTSSDWYGAAGGVSYVNSFTWGDNTPAFVFTALLNYNTKNVAEATSHEIGHTLGLRHQSSYDNNCVKTAEYNPGTGSGEIAWAPIMGVGYYRNFTLWNNGANPYGCTDYQDDLGIITTNTGFSYRADDYSGNPTGGATSVPFVNNQFTISGVIEKISDQDAFKFTVTTPGNFHLNALPYNIGSGNVGSNLDMQVDLLTNGQTLLGSYNPANSLSATIDTILNPGTYWLRVQGKGNMFAPEYASLGSYSLNAIMIPFGVLPVHQLVLHGMNEKGRHKFNWSIVADETVTAQDMEVSINGKPYEKLQSLTGDARGFAYLPDTKGMLSYRLNVHFDNGQQSYSNVVVLQNNGEGRPSLVSNLVDGSALVKSPAAYNYQLFDSHGKTISRGLITQGITRINTGNIRPGVYVIRFANEMEQFTEKLVKE